MNRMRPLTATLLLLGALLLAACDKGPDEAAVREELITRLAAALQPPVTDVVSFRRIGSGPLPATADGKARQIVYYNAVLELTHDVAFASWNGLNATAFATLLGATEKGVGGIKQDGNKAGDKLYVHGTATFVDEAGQWAAVPWVSPAVGEGSPENNTGPPSEARRLLGSIDTLLTGGGGPRELRNAIVAEELAKSLDWIQLRIDRLDQAFVLAGGQAGGEYAKVAALIAGQLAGHGLEARMVTTDGSVANARLVHQKLADVGLIQNDVAGMAARGEEAFAADGAMGELRALGSLFPEPIQIVTTAGSPLATLAGLKGKRVELGQSGSGTRANAEAVLMASGVALSDLGGIDEGGLAAGLQRLAAGEVDAVIATIAAPARALQEAAAGPGIKLLPVPAEALASLAVGHPALVPVTLPANTYPGQAAAIDTVAVTALLVGRDDLSDATVETLLREVYGGIDFVQAGSAAGALISRATAQRGITLPWHPAAERYLLRPTATQ